MIIRKTAALPVARRMRARTAFVLAALSALLVSGCDSDEEPVEDTSSEMDMTEVDTAPMIEPCPATGALLQAQPVVLELLEGEAGVPTTATIRVNSGGEGQLCFPATDAITVSPELEGLEFGPLMANGTEVDALDPGQQGTIEVTWTPPAGNVSGQSLISLSPSNASAAEVQLRYASTGGIDAMGIGTLEAEVDVGYIYDGEQWDADSLAQREAHPEGLLRTSGLSGLLSDEDVPSPEAIATRTFVLHRGTSLTVHQRSFQGEAFASPYAQPQVELTFPTDTIEPGTYTIDPSAPDTSVVLKVITLESSEVPGEPAERCLLAVGFGQLTVTAATDTDQPEGGTLAFSADVINLYYVDNTPQGDIAQEVGESCSAIDPMTGGGSFP